MPAHRPTATPRAGSATRRRAAVIGPSLLAIALAGAVSMGSAGAQVDPEPDPTTTAIATTAVPTTMTPTTVVVTTVAQAPIVAPTVATTQRPVVTTVPTTLVPNAAGVQVPSTTTSRPSSTTSSTTAGLLVESQETVTSEPVAESADEGLSSTDKLRLVVAALIAIAVVVAVLTVGYWRKTRPYEWEEWDEHDEEGDADLPAHGGAVTGAAATVPVTRAARPDAVAEPPAVPGATAARPAMPVVPSLIEPDLRARLSSSSSPVGDHDAATQAMPIVTGADTAGGEPDPAATPGEPARWGTGRAQGEPIISADPSSGADLDAPFRPPRQPGD